MCKKTSPNLALKGLHTLLVARDLLEADSCTDFATHRGNAAFGFREKQNQTFLFAHNTTPDVLSKKEFDSLHAR